MTGTQPVRRGRGRRPRSASRAAALWPRLGALAALLALAAMLSAACSPPWTIVTGDRDGAGIPGAVKSTPSSTPVAPEPSAPPLAAVGRKPSSDQAAASPTGSPARAQPAPPTGAPTTDGSPPADTPVPPAEPTETPGEHDSARGPAVVESVLARSVEGRAIRVVELGRGPLWIALIGGIHQGDESNTTDLVNLLLDHLSQNLDEIPEEVGLAFIPDLNPDGAAAGTRTNANGVDLNRNWDAGWQADTYALSGPIEGGGGPRPFSEPESRALARYLAASQFTAAIFYHSQGGVVVPGVADGADHGSDELARNLAQAAGYIYLAEWTAYPVSGQAADYLAGLGIHAVDVELSTHTDPEFARNLRGLRAAIEWVLASAPTAPA